MLVVGFLLLSCKMDKKIWLIIFIVLTISVDAREDPFLISGYRTESSNSAGSLIRGNSYRTGKIKDH